MSRKPKVWGYGVTYPDGGTAICESERTAQSFVKSLPGTTYIELGALVPLDPDAARVLRLVERFLRGNLFDESSVAALRDLRVAVERRQKRGAK